MKTFRKNGHSHLVTLTAAVLSGGVVGPLGTSGRFGIAVVDGAVGDEIATETSGVHELDAGTTLTWADGDTLYWDAGSSQLTDSATGNSVIGPAVGEKGAGDETAQVLVNNAPSK